MSKKSKVRRAALRGGNQDVVWRECPLCHVITTRATGYNKTGKYQWSCGCTQTIDVVTQVQTWEVNSQGGDWKKHDVEIPKDFDRWLNRQVMRQAHGLPAEEYPDE